MLVDGYVFEEFLNASGDGLFNVFKSLVWLPLVVVDSFLLRKKWKRIV